MTPHCYICNNDPCTCPSRDEEIPTPMSKVIKIANEQMRECGCRPGSFIYGCTHAVRRLRAALIRLSAEREEDANLIRRLLKGIEEKDIVRDLRATLAERDKELAAVKRELAMATDAANKGDDARCKAGAMSDMIDDLTAQLLAAQTVNGKLREALQNILKMTAGHYGIEKAANAALALSPDPTLLDEVDDEDVKAAVALIVEAESECHAYNPSVTRISTRLHKALSRLRQSTRETLGNEKSI